MHVWMQNQILSSTSPLSMAYHSLMDKGLPIIEASRSHSDTPLAVGFLWTLDQPELCLLAIYK